MSTPTSEEKRYLRTLRAIVRKGDARPDRTGIGTKFIPGHFATYDLRHNRLPIWTVRAIPWRNQWVELVWFLRGASDVAWLQERRVNIWNSWVKPDGTIGPGYGKQWRDFDGVDQFAKLIAGLKADPWSRRHVVTLWNPTAVDACALPPCHGDVIQFVVDSRRGLHCLQHQRSADMVLGYCPWQYAMLTHVVAALTDTTPSSLSVTVGDAHVYNNHADGVREMLRRVPSPHHPTFTLNKPLTSIADVEALTLDDVAVDYRPHPRIVFPVAV